MINKESVVMSEASRRESRESVFLDFGSVPHDYLNRERHAIRFG